MMFYGWAPQPIRKEGDFEFLAPMIKAYFEGQEEFNRRRDLGNLSKMNRNYDWLSPGLKSDLESSGIMPGQDFVPKSKEIGSMWANTQMRQMFPTSYEQYLHKKLEQPAPYKLSESKKNALRVYRSDLDGLLEDNKISRLEYNRRNDELEAWFADPRNANATPLQMELFYDGITRKPEKQSRAPVSPSSVNELQAGMGSGVMTATKSKYVVGQPIKGPDGKTYKVVGFDTDGEPLVEEI